MATSSNNAQPATNGSEPRNALTHSPPILDSSPNKEPLVENFRTLRVVVIGAGFSGIYLNIRIPELLRNVDLVTYEREAGIGGTWWINRYPGCGCDIPAHSYVYSFELNLDWSKFYASATEIQAYLQRVVDKYSAARRIKLKHEHVGTIQQDKAKRQIDTAEERRRFTENKDEYHAFRKVIETEGNSMYPVTIAGSEMSLGAQEHFKKLMQIRLVKKPGLAKFLIPSFPPGCRRLTPGPGFLESLVENNVDVVTTYIRKVLPSGVQLVDGTTIELDMLVCATGFSFAAAPDYPFVGSKGMDLKERYKDYPEAYLSMAVDGFPNFFMMLGPNTAVGAGSATKILECQGDYIVKCIRKIQKENIGSMEISPRAMNDWIRHINGYFKRTVFLADCKSWYRRNDRIIGIWPGSTCHAIETMRSPRWEDFSYTFADESLEHNRLGWLGNGLTDIEQNGGDNS
ncbi:flavin-binding monooxygenase protein [Stemphylium lycopersici]|nr:flavin-binding monooxygenase protein [Stemphylium lycopersici]